METLFTLVFLERRRAELLSTRALVQVSMPAHKENQDPAIEAFEKYCDVMFPFMERAAKKEEEDARAALKKFVSKRVRFSLFPIAKQQAEQAKRKAMLRRFTVRPTMPGMPYKHKEV